MVVPFGLQQFQILPTLLLILAEISDGLCSYSYDNVFNQNTISNCVLTIRLTVSQLICHSAVETSQLCKSARVSVFK